MLVSLNNSINWSVKILMTCLLILIVSISANLNGYARSYNVQRLGQAYLGPSISGYICGYENFAYVSKRDSFAIVDLTDPYNPQVWVHKLDGEIESAHAGHGKAYVWDVDGSDKHIHLILPGRSWWHSGPKTSTCSTSMSPLVPF